jgi:hypothetical protein
MSIKTRRPKICNYHLAVFLPIRNDTIISISTAVDINQKGKLIKKPRKK